MMIKAVLSLAFVCLVAGKPHHDHGRHHGNHKHDTVLNTGARPSTGTCGNPTHKPNEQNQFIVGGQEANPYSYPWMATLETSSGFQFCGASLIGPFQVVTAAHCVGPDDRNTIIGLGLHDKYHQDTHSPLIQKMKVQSIEQHARYDNTELLNDIAIITFTERVEYNERVSIVCLPSSQKPVGTLATATGWGATSEGGSSASKLREVTKPIVSYAQCKTYYDKIGWNVFEDEMLCAGYPEGGKDACQGDSGGPLVVKTSGHAHGDSWELVGITSWGYGCARPEYPGVYADVYNYVNWIKDRLVL